jgi:hypothetical protein
LLRTSGPSQRLCPGRILHDGMLSLCTEWVLRDGTLSLRPEWFSAPVAITGNPSSLCGCPPAQ